MSTLRPLSILHHRLTSKIDGLVLGLKKGGQLGPAAEAVNRVTQSALSRSLQLSGHSGKANEVRILYGVAENFPRIAVVGLNDKLSSSETSRQASAVAVRALRDIGAKELAIDPLLSSQAAAEGAVLGLYSFDSFKKPDEDRRVVHSIGLFQTAESDNEKLIAEFEYGFRLAQTQNMARYLEDMPANHMTPTIFAEQATKLLEGLKDVELKVHDEEWARAQNMNAFLYVAKGSEQPLRFLEIRYTPLPNEAPIALVGKGITFDSGGISIKPSAKMGDMKADMSGAAVVLTAIKVAAQESLKCNVVALIPLCENMPSGRAAKPGDVVTTRSGKTVEIDNTDAEGRLILCDALSYAATHKPKAILDFATLTGAMDVALGSGAAGVFVNNDQLWKQIEQSSAQSDEPLWRMPIFDVYREAVKSGIADLVNSTNSRSAGACTAAAFLESFVDSNTPWAHFDIAGVMQSDKTQHYHIKGMSGRPLRAVMEFLKQHEKH